MERPTVPTAEQLKDAALSDSIVVLLQLAASEVVVVRELVNVGETVRALRIQAERLGGATDKASGAILECHAAAETLLDRCAEAAHLVLRDMARKALARYN